MTSITPNAESDLDQTPIDFVELSDIYGIDDIADLCDIVREFLTDYESLAERLKLAFETQNRDDLSTTAHAASGSAKYAAALPLAKILFDIEMKAKSDDFREISIVMAAASNEVSRIKEELNARHLPPTPDRDMS